MNMKKTIFFVIGVFLIAGTFFGNSFSYLANWSNAELIGYNTWTLVSLIGGAFLIYKAVKN